jgi:hypothetical protein
MKYKNGDVRQLENILSCLNMERPVSPDDQSYILKGKTGEYHRLVKQLGLASGIGGIALYAAYLLKKVGFWLSWKAIVTVVASSVLVTAGTYYYTKSGSVTRTDQLVTETTAAISPVKESKTDIPENKKTAPVKTKCILVVSGITSSTNSDVVAKELEKKIIEGINWKSGAHISEMAKASGPGARYTLTGSVEKKNGDYLLFIKVLDNDNMSIAYLAKEKFVQGDAVDSLSESIVTGILSRIR